MFTLEIGGRPVAITNADEARAWAIFESDQFKQDLTVLTSDGIPLWDGRARLSIRPASDEEVAFFEAPPLEGADGLDEEDDSLFITFLVPIDHDHADISALPPELRS
jgi:hypothetical protein